MVDGEEGRPAAHTRQTYTCIHTRIYLRQRHEPLAVLPALEQTRILPLVLLITALFLALLLILLLGIGLRLLLAPLGRGGGVIVVGVVLLSFLGPNVGVSVRIWLLIQRPSRIQVTHIIYIHTQTNINKNTHARHPRRRRPPRPWAAFACAPDRRRPCLQ